MTVRFVVLFLECTFVQLFQTESANKVFRMEFTEHCGNTTTGYWFMAPSTEGTPLGVIVSLTIWLTIMVEERTTMERLMAFL